MENQCTLTRSKDGKLKIETAPDVFLATRKSVEDLLIRHNDLLEQRDELRKEIREMIESFRTTIRTRAVFRL